MRKFFDTLWWVVLGILIVVSVLMNIVLSNELDDVKSRNKDLSEYLEYYRPTWSVGENFKKYTEKWNGYIKNGQYPQRINDELLVMPDGQEAIYRLDSIQNGYFKKTYVGISAIVINTDNQTVSRLLINDKLIRQVNSNWGLTQEVEEIKKKLKKAKIK